MANAGGRQFNHVLRGRVLKLSVLAAFKWAASFTLWPPCPSLCGVKPLLLRTLVASCGAALLVLAYGLDSRTLALFAAMALLGAEALGLAGVAAKHESALSRALLGTCEALCGLAVSLIEPTAMLVALTQVVYSVIASGVATVSLSLGKPLTQARSEPMRRLLSTAANIGLCIIVLQASGVLSPEGVFDLRPRNVDVLNSWRNLGMGPRNLAMLCMALVIVGSARSIGELALKAQWTK
ncbi:hypothetical protein PLCT2_01882 [Planctomycetaceae bacterium]|nr:hypothetical protein PLCT2_01882 [Planctomycetaceae bacterium]